MRLRVWLVAIAAVVVALAALCGAALLFWPQVHLDPSDAALARLALPGFAGRVSGVEVSSTEGPVSVEVRRGEVWPAGLLAAGERLTVVVTVRRPGWSGWLVGYVQRRSFAVLTPSAHLVGRWLQVASGTPVTVAFDRPVTLVSFHGSSTRLSQPRAVVPVGVVARGRRGAGSVEVAAAARAWERLSAPVQVSWFPARSYPQLLVSPSPAARLTPAGRLTLTFSEPVADVLGSARPRLSPATPGHWLTLDAHTIAFQPSGFGFGLGTAVRLTLPGAVHVAGRPGATQTRTLRWQVPQGSILRMQQLLAQLGYLPLAWAPTHHSATSLAAQLAAAVSPPAGRFTWRYPRLRSMLSPLWQSGQYTVCLQGAVMAFEADHGLTTDGLVGSQVWIDLLQAAVRHQVDRHPYDFIQVSKGSPETLSVWRAGRIVYSSPCNTGIAARPTADGTFPVYARYLSTTMSGTNPDGSHYSDPGVPYVAYFNGGDAVHSFPRPGYGWPQSLGCVELPYTAAAVVYTYDPIGTLVSVS